MQKIIYRMILCPLNGESSKNVFSRIICLFAVNNDQIYGDTKTRCLHYFQPLICAPLEHKMASP